LFFFHNPKAGGISLREILWHRFGQDRICPPLDVQDPHLRQVVADGYRTVQGFDLYMGHFGYDMFRAVESGHAAITNFRHPAARLTSLYNFFRITVQLTPEQLATPTHAAVRMAKTGSFEDFVLCDDPMVAMYTSDFHFRQLANSPWSMAVTRSMGEVVDMIEAMPWFYVCEFPEASYLWARSAFGWRFDQVRRENITKAGDSEAISVLSISDSLYQRMMARNARDLALYRMAIDRLMSATSYAEPVRQVIAAE
jgi:hypothetical protein